MIERSAQPPCGQACDLLEQARARIQHLEQQVSIDALTGLWNRAHFDNVIEAEIQRSLRHRQPVSLILFDIDHFKLINDTWGHPAGDRVLRELAVLCRALTRSSDALFRWGGEEFAVLLNDAGYRNAQRIAENLRQAIAVHAFSIAQPVTVSLGVAEHHATQSVDEWFARVDAALYAAKHQGRNRAHTDHNGNSDTWGTQPGNFVLRLVWQEAYASGHLLIEQQHQTLFSLANQLIDQSASTAITAGDVQGAFKQLLQHIAMHFACEEELLAQVGYPHVHAHGQAHRRLLSRAQKMFDDCQNDQISLGKLVQFVAIDVVAKHILQADRDFFPLLAANV